MIPMTDDSESATQLEVAYYYPEPYWGTNEVDSIKTLLLFFDEIATLLPRYMRGREVSADPVLAGPLVEAGLLRVLEPEGFIDQQMTEELSTILAELLANGAFDDLDRNVHYAELSHSRLGWDADVSLARMVIDELEVRGLAKPSRDGVSVPLHPAVRTAVLVLLGQLARKTGQRHGMSLHPTAGRVNAVRTLLQTLSLAHMPSAGHIVALDLQTVAVNLASVPLDEILSFRNQHGQSYRAYARDLRSFLVQLGAMERDVRLQALRDREEELADRAADLRRTARRAWRLPLASFSLGLAGAAWEAIGQDDVVSALLALGAGIAGMLALEQRPAGAYSYLFEAHQAFNV
jgi:hypothetical protein